MVWHHFNGSISDQHGWTLVNHEDVDSPKPPSCHPVIVEVQKTDGVTEIPYERWDVDEYFDPSPNAVGRIWAICKCGVSVDHCWWTCWSPLRMRARMTMTTKDEDYSFDYHWLSMKEFIFAWLKGMISWLSTVSIYLQLHLYIIYIYNSKQATLHGRTSSRNLLFHFQKLQNNPTQTHNQPKKRA